MKCRMLVITAVLLAFASIGKAEISQWNCAPDGDGVISLNSPVQWGETGSGEYAMTMNAAQTKWDYGHMVGWFVSDGDPTIKFDTSLDNDTGSEWTDYHVNIYMDQPFTIVPNSAYVTIPSDWNPNSVITGVTGGGHLDAHGNYHQYEGSIDYYAGTPVSYNADPDLTGSLEFGYKVSYSLSGTINFTQEMYPTPEPGTLVLLVSGLTGLLVIRRRYS